jgi:hypothetical protein
MAVTQLTPEIEFDEISDYSQVIQQLTKRPTPMHLLLGNGFSMAYDHKIFSYNALYDFIESLNDKLLSKLFSLIKTKNFELIMRQLDNFIEIANSFGSDPKLVALLQAANEKLQNSLIDAVSNLHPDHVFEVPEEKSKACFDFIQTFLDKGGFVFSTNYDLLLYWVLMRNESDKAGDGFGRELENEDGLIKGEDAEFSDLLWGKNKNTQTVYYLHGALPFFDTGYEIEKEVYTNRNYLLGNIKARLNQKEYPIFVTAGDGAEKLNHITHNKYLNYCYESLCNATGSIVSFGFNFGEYDDHIIHAINKAAKYRKDRDGKLYSVYIGVYSEADLDHIKSIAHKFNCKVNVFSSRTAKVWG